MLHPSPLLYKRSSPKCQFSLSCSSQTKIKTHRLARLPFSFTFSAFFLFFFFPLPFLSQQSAGGSRDSALRLVKARRTHTHAHATHSENICSHLSPNPKQTSTSQCSADTSNEKGTQATA